MTDSGPPPTADVCDSPSEAAELVTVITVVKNDADGLIRTLQSIASQCHQNRTSVVIDGASGAETQIALERHASEIGILISEPDQGIYDAMNKGLRLARSDWVILLNAGDCFNGCNVLSEAMQYATSNVDVIYSDALFQHGGIQERVCCNINGRRIHHQSMIYRRSLHLKFGEYLAAPGVTISDYIFFNLIAEQSWVKVERPIAVCDVTGVSSRPMAYYQKLAVDLIFRNRGPHVIGIMLLVYPIYRLLIRPLVRLCQRIALR